MAHLAEGIERVVARRAVGAERHDDAGAPQLRRPGRRRSPGACSRRGSGRRSACAPGQLAPVRFVRVDRVRDAGPGPSGRPVGQIARCSRAGALAGRARHSARFSLACVWIGAASCVCAYSAAARRSASVQLTANRGCTATRSRPRSRPCQAAAQPLGLGESFVRAARAGSAGVVAGSSMRTLPPRVADAGARRGAEERVRMPDGSHVEDRRHAGREALGEAQPRGDRHRLGDRAPPLRARRAARARASSSRSSGPLRRSVWQRWRCAWTKPGSDPLAPRVQPLDRLARQRRPGGPPRSPTARDRAALGVEVRRGPDVPRRRQSEQRGALDEQAAHAGRRLGVGRGRARALLVTFVLRHRQAANHQERPVVRVRLAGGVLPRASARARRRCRPARVRSASARNSFRRSMPNSSPAGLLASVTPSV